MGKVLIAMSGGVDSSVTAKLVHDAGHQCIGCTMKLYNNTSEDAQMGRTCCTLEDAEDARSVAFGIGIPYYVFNFTESFEECVIKRFVEAYEKGQTPNPCIDCNRFLKFERLFYRAKELGCDYLATGHYARIERDSASGTYLLKKGLDDTKDQSYVLYSMTQEQLAHTLFPLGALTKKQVREIAAQSGFVTAEKEESQDICFVPDGDYASFIRGYTHKEYPAGDFIDMQGNTVGHHQGIIGYTVGQRKGLGIALGKPVYVRQIDVEHNTVTVCEQSDLYSTALVANAFNWISGVSPAGAVKCKAKIRYRQREQDATAICLEDGSVKVTFDNPQSAIALGQAVVLYDGDTVLGGGTIASVC